MEDIDKLIDTTPYPIYNDEDLTVYFPDCEESDNQIIPQ
jgi:hypothetical protein